MKRSPELTPLSRDHHTALARALGLRRASAGDVASAVEAFVEYFASDGDRHFDQEERLLLPELAPHDAALGERVLAEHTDIRARVAAIATAPDVEPARELGERVAAHVRFEERELFPLLEECLPPERLAEIGAQLG